MAERQNIWALHGLISRFGLLVDRYGTGATSFSSDAHTDLQQQSTLLLATPRSPRLRGTNLLGLEETCRSINQVARAVTLADVMTRHSGHAIFEIESEASRQQRLSADVRPPQSNATRLFTSSMMSSFGCNPRTPARPSVDRQFGSLACSV